MAELIGTGVISTKTRADRSTYDPALHFASIFEDFIHLFLAGAAAHFTTRFHHRTFGRNPQAAWASPHLRINNATAWRAVGKVGTMFDRRTGPAQIAMACIQGMR